MADENKNKNIYIYTKKRGSNIIAKIMYKIIK